MRTRPLGSTGLEVSEIGFGAWGLGGTMWLGVPEDDADRAFEASLDSGVTFVDTALAYGDGKSERRVGRIVRGRGDRDRIRIATKIPPKNFVWPGHAEHQITDTFPSAWVRECVERSLRHLGVDSLDVQQFHVWHDAWLDDPSWADTRAEMVRLRDQGKVRHWGVSINDHAPETAMRLLEDPLLESAQLIYNLYDRSPERGFFGFARRRNLAVIVRVPFDEGALTGAIGPDTTFPEGDWRNRYFAGNRRAEAARRADALRGLLGEEAATLPELALRFVLSRDEVSTVIPGSRHAAHAAANASVSDGRRLSPPLLDRLKGHAWEKNWYGA